MDLTLKTKLAELTKERKQQQNLSLAEMARLSGLSSTNLSFIVSEKWQEKIIDNGQWDKLAKWHGIENDWVTVITPTYKRIHAMCADAEANSIMLAISGRQGTGKSHALKDFRDAHPKNVFYIQCHEFWNRKEFLNKVKAAIGIDIYPQSINENMQDIVAALRKIKRPVLILDEADELKEANFRFIKSFYNLLEDHGCGFIICGGNHLAKRINKGVSMCRQSYQEILSRIGGELKPVHPVNDSITSAICKANGITDRTLINEVINTSGNDLRAVQRRVHLIKLRLQKGGNRDAA